MKTEKRLNCISMGKTFLWIFVFLAITTSCQKDDIFSDPAFNAAFKAKPAITEIEPGRYEGYFADYGFDWLISLPDASTWNNLDYRYMIVYAHGMVDPVPYAPIELPSDIIGGRSVEEIIVGNNMGYASTSYEDNGLVVLEAVENIKELADIVYTFFKTYRKDFLPPDLIFLGGPSEGGLVTIKTIEKYPHLFDGAVSIGAPIGDFWDQLQYMGDFHVLFNYFFGPELTAMGIDIGNPEDGVDAGIMSAWKNKDFRPPYWGYHNLQEVIQGLMSSRPDKVAQLISCAKVSVDMTDEIAVGTAVLELLRFNIMLTNDIHNRMGGVPFDNTRKWYWGSDNDWRLNRSVQRIHADYTARYNVKKYETSGEIEIPVVCIHTTGDHVVPFWHNPKYRYKAFINGNSLLHTGIPVDNYGHCTIDEAHVMAALYIIICKVRLMDYFQLSNRVFESQEQLNIFKEILKDNSIDVEFK